MAIIPWNCAHGDAPPVAIAAAATVAISPDDDSVDTNTVAITGSGTITSFGACSTPITKRVHFMPTGTITLVHSSPSLRLSGSVNKTITQESFGEYQCDGASNWTELSFSTPAQPIPGLLIGRNVYNASQTVTIPQGATKANVILGGAGGSYNTIGMVGAAGATCCRLLTGLTAGLTLTLAVGVGVPQNDGQASTLSSGTQTISPTMTAGGGQGGASPSPVGGAASGGDLNIPGGSVFMNAASAPTPGMSATGYGNGGQSGAGTAGICIIDWYS